MVCRFDSYKTDFRVFRPRTAWFLVLPALWGALLFAGLFAGTEPASAQQLLARHGNWSAYVWTENGNKVCYIFSKPTKQEGDYSRRGEPYAMVSRRMGGKTSEEVSVTSGYPYDEKSKVRLKIDGKNYALSLIDKELAWADEAVVKDATIVRSMVKGLTLSVRGTSKKGTFSLDTYSLRGFSAARKAIVKACP